MRTDRGSTKEKAKQRIEPKMEVEKSNPPKKKTQKETIDPSAETKKSINSGLIV